MWSFNWTPGISPVFVLPLCIWQPTSTPAETHKFHNKTWAHLHLVWREWELLFLSPENPTQGPVSLRKDIYMAQGIQFWLVQILRKMPVIHPVGMTFFSQLNGDDSSKWDRYWISFFTLPLDSHFSSKEQFTQKWRWYHHRALSYCSKPIWLSFPNSTQMMKLRY